MVEDERFRDDDGKLDLDKIKRYEDSSYKVSLLLKYIDKQQAITLRLNQENENLRKQVKSSETTSNATSNYNAFLESKITTLEAENENLQKELGDMMGDKRFKVCIDRNNGVGLFDNSVKLIFIKFTNQEDAVSCKDSLKHQCNLMNELYEENEQLKETNERLQWELDKTRKDLSYFTNLKVGAMRGSDYGHGRCYVISMQKKR